MSLADQEIERYKRLYADDPEYRFKGVRADLVRSMLDELTEGYSTLLDVGAGRGEVVDYMRERGFDATGVDPAAPGHPFVSEASATALPHMDMSVDVVTMFDVIEHLPPGDDEKACRELERVARHLVIINASNRSAMHPKHGELHINRRPYPEWDRLFREWFEGDVVYHSQHWKGHAWYVLTGGECE